MPCGLVRGVTGEGIIKCEDVPEDGGGCNGRDDKSKGKGYDVHDRVQGEAGHDHLHEVSSKDGAEVELGNRMLEHSNGSKTQVDLQYRRAAREQPSHSTFGCWLIYRHTRRG